MLRAYRLESGARDTVVASPALEADDATFPWASYASVNPFRFGGSDYLACYSNGQGVVDVLRCIGGPYLFEKAAHFPLAVKWDSICVAIVGNRPYLLCYGKASGQFAFLEIGPDLKSRAPYVYSRLHEPAGTTGLTTLKVFVNRGLPALLGYDDQSGRVALYSLSATATSEDGIPPLVGHHTWSALWARGWTRFAFFQFGGANFFLKTNTWRANVNIDRVLDDLTQGTTEVTSHMDAQLPDAQALVSVEPFVLDSGDPYFATYKPTGELALYRIHSDCRGWTRAAALQTAPALAKLFTFGYGEARYLGIC